MSISLNKLGQVSIVCDKTDIRQGIDSLAYWTLTNKVKEEQKILGIRVDERPKHIDNREKIGHLK